MQQQQREKRALLARRNGDLGVTVMHSQRAQHSKLHVSDGTARKRCRQASSRRGSVATHRAPGFTRSSCGAALRQRHSSAASVSAAILCAAIDAEEVTMSPSLRPLLPYVGPVGFTITTALHPMVPGGAADIAAQGALWLTLHVVQVGLTIGLGWTLWTLVAGADSPGATVTRVAAWVFTATYAAFDAVVGIGTGVVATHGASLSGAEQAVALAAADALFTHPLGFALAATGGVAWLVGSLAVVVVHRRAGAPTTVLISLSTSGALFALTHVGVSGTAAAFALLYAVYRTREPYADVAHVHVAQQA